MYVESINHKFFNVITLQVIMGIIDLILLTLRELMFCQCYSVLW
jgi:hypothetical protein